MTDTSRWPDLATALAAILVGTFAVNVDLHNDEVQAAALVLMVGGFLLGAVRPRGAWRWALILSLSIFVGEVLGYELGLVEVHQDPGWNFGALVALIPAFIGTYVWVGVRSAMHAATSGK